MSIFRREYCPAIGDKSAQGRGGMQVGPLLLPPKTSLRRSPSHMHTHTEPMLPTHSITQAKIDAAMGAVKNGVPSVVIASGHEPGVVGKVAAGLTVGTLFSRAVLFPPEGKKRACVCGEGGSPCPRS